MRSFELRSLSCDLSSPLTRWDHPKSFRIGSNLIWRATALNIQGLHIQVRQIQVRQHCTSSAGRAVRAKPGSGQIYWMVSAEPRSLGWRFLCRPAHGWVSGEKQEREPNKPCSGEGHFLSGFRNLPAVLCVPMPEQDFLYLGSTAVSGQEPRRFCRSLDQAIGSSGLIKQSSSISLNELLTNGEE